MILKKISFVHENLVDVWLGNKDYCQNMALLPLFLFKQIALKLNRILSKCYVKYS